MNFTPLYSWLLSAYAIPFWLTVLTLAHAYLLVPLLKRWWKVENFANAHLALHKQQDELLEKFRQDEEKWRSRHAEQMEGLRRDGERWREKNAEQMAEFRRDSERHRKDHADQMAEWRREHAEQLAEWRKDSEQRHKEHAEKLEEWRMRHDEQMAELRRDGERWLEKLRQDEAEWRKDHAELHRNQEVTSQALQKEFASIRGVHDLIYKHFIGTPVSDSALAKNSPLTLSDFGKELARKLDAEKMVSRLLPCIRQHVQAAQPRNAYELQESCQDFQFLREALSEEERDLVDRIAFDEGTHRWTVLSVIAVLARDRLLPEYNWPSPQAQSRDPHKTIQDSGSSA